MSWQATSWASKQVAGSSTGKCLLLLLANCADQSGVCFPGHAILAEQAECSQRSIITHISLLAERGLLSCHYRGRENGSRTTNWIVLAPPEHAVDRGDMLDVSPDLAGRREAMCRSRTVQERGGPEVISSTTKLLKQKEEITTVAKSATDSASSPPLPGFDLPPAQPKGGTDDPRASEVFDHWVQTFDPPRTNLSASRLKLIQRALRETESADVCKTAINGLRVWRTLHPGDESLGAVFQTRPGGSSLGDQIDFWVKQAEEGGMQMVGRVPTNLSGVPAVTAGTIRSLRDAVQGAVSRPEDETAQASGRYAMAQLAEQYGHEPVSGGDVPFRQTAAWRLIEDWERPRS